MIVPRNSGKETISDRIDVLDVKRRLKMARSAHAYVRGNTIKFYEWLDSSRSAKRLPEGPPVWICGDCHLGNLGPLSDGMGKVDIQIRDLDQTVIGNPAHDLIRLGLSLATAARGSDLPGVTTALMVEEMADGYLSALADRNGGSPGPEPDVVRTVRRRSLARGWRQLARERIVDETPVIPLGKKFWPLHREERAALGALLTDPGVRQAILAMDKREEGSEITLVDAAYWIKGCSSLGLLRYAVIIEIGAGSKNAQYAIIDIKEATEPAAPSAEGISMPADPAMRVVTGARALSPHLGNRMMAAELLGKSVFIRELSPKDLKLEVEQFSQGQAVKAARYLAYVVGRAHARQMDERQRAEWQRILLDHRGTSLEAPSWLWRSVVDLSGMHEMGYLDHCRRYALDTAA